MDRFEAALSEAVALRREGRMEEARTALLELHSAHPQHPQVNLQTAWVHDRLGLETEAVPYYQAAITAGLEGDDLYHAMVGLGSTLRALGRYQEALAVLDEGVRALPGRRALEVFRAMALYNTGRGKEACEVLLRVLIDTTGDPEVRSYQRALAFYAEDLDRIWA